VVFTHHLPTIYPPFTHYFSIIAIAVYLWYIVDIIRTAMILILAKTEPALKSDVKGIFKELGLCATEAINLFYRQVRLKKGLPFDAKMAVNDSQR
jgi:addiction module RelB/DinJ family antitoxin